MRSLSLLCDLHGMLCLVLCGQSFLQKQSGRVRPSYWVVQAGALCPPRLTAQFTGSEEVTVEPGVSIHNSRAL